MINLKEQKLGEVTRKSFSRTRFNLELPNLVEIQTKSFDWFVKKGLGEVLQDVSPITDYSGNLVIEFIDYTLDTDKPKYPVEECKERDVNFAAPLRVRVRLTNKATGEVKVSAASKLAEVAVETAKTAKLFGIDPKVAVLSFSTKGSGKGGTVALSHDAVIKAQEMDPELAVDGELQFDAAVAPEVAQVKCKGSKVAGQANTFVFPCIEAGNIGYKIAQRLGGYAAYGPILQGLNAPINDLSRGCNADEVYKMSLITACQS